MLQSVKTTPNGHHGYLRTNVKVATSLPPADEGRMWFNE